MIDKQIYAVQRVVSVFNENRCLTQPNARVYIHANFGRSKPPIVKFICD